MLIQYAYVEETHYAKMPELANLRSTTGGAFATVTLPDEAPEWHPFRNVFPHLAGLTPTIVVFRDAMASLTAEEQEAILLHEEGHLRLRHVTAEMTLAAYRGAETEQQMIDDVEKELEADAYASDRVGPAAMHSALRKAILGTAEGREEVTGMSDDEIIAYVRERSEAARRRLDTLCPA